MRGRPSAARWPLGVVEQRGQAPQSSEIRGWLINRFEHPFVVEKNVSLRPQCVEVEAVGALIRAP